MFHDVEGAEIAFASGAEEEKAAIMGPAFDTGMITDNNYENRLYSGAVWPE